MCSGCPAPGGGCFFSSPEEPPAGETFSFLFGQADPDEEARCSEEHGVFFLRGLGHGALCFENLG